MQMPITLLVKLIIPDYPLIYMVRLSNQLINLIKDDIITYLYNNQLKSYFTNQIAKEVRRDNEFTLKLLIELKQQGLIEQINKNKLGKNYLARVKWRIPPDVIKAYEQRNKPSN